MGRTPLLGLMFLAACGGPSSRPPAASLRAGTFSDSSFAEVQARGHTAMGVDQYTSYHRFESLPDGGRIALQRDPHDSQGVTRIRAHMDTVARAFARGNFAAPGFVHDQDVPGTSVMAARRSRIRYTAHTLPGGGAVRLQTSDSAALAAIHQFLTFQRRDHRSAGHGTAP